MKVVYIAGKYSAKSTRARNRNIAIAADLATKVWNLGAAAICPHINNGGKDFDHKLTISYEEVMIGCLAMIGKCDIVLFAPDWEDSPGAVREHAEAKRLKKPIVYNIKELAKELNKKSYKCSLTGNIITQEPELVEGVKVSPKLAIKVKKLLAKQSDRITKRYVLIPRNP